MIRLTRDLIMVRIVVAERWRNLYLPEDQEMHLRHERGEELTTYRTSFEGEVLACGPRVEGLEKGDYVYLHKWCGTPFVFEGDRVLVTQAERALLKRKGN